MLYRCLGCGAVPDTSGKVTHTPDCYCNHYEQLKRGQGQNQVDVTAIMPKECHPAAARLERVVERFERLLPIIANAHRNDHEVVTDSDMAEEANLVCAASWYMAEHVEAFIEAKRK
jgi:hypothetical protein